MLVKTSFFERIKIMHILGKAMDKEFWQKAREDARLERFRQILFKDWKMLMEEGSLKALKYSEWRMFFVTGERTTYQKSYEHHRHAATVSAMLSLLYPEEEKYINYLMDAIYTLCDEYTWSYPAHQGGNFTDNNNTIIDLTGSRVGMDLAEMYVLFGDRLEPLIRSRILAEIDRRIFTPFETQVPYGWWEECSSNWGSVCMNSVAKTYMLLRPEKAREYIERFNKTMYNFIGGFSDEGICFEGMGYWSFGFGAFLDYIKTVKAFTDGEVNFFSIPKIKDMSLFYQRMFLSGHAVANFADSEMYLSPGALSRSLKKYYPEINVPSIEKTAFYSSNEFNGKLSTVLSVMETDTCDEDKGDNYDSEFFAPSAQWFVKHTPLYGFAAKGGNNGEFHNHNDVGHFIYAKDGKQILCDVGVGIYTANYFGKHRYECLEPSSKCHSVPIIDGELQSPGKEYAARDFKYEDNILSVDISDAYAVTDSGERIERAFCLGAEGFKMTDRFTFNKKRELVERLVTKIEPDFSVNGEVKIDSVSVRYDAEKWECYLGGSEPSARDQKPCYYIDFKPIGELSDFVIKVDKYE